MKVMVVLLHLFPILGLTFANSYLAEFQSARNRFVAKETLGYGDSCDSAAEKRRTDFNIDIHKRMVKISSIGELSTIAADLDTLGRSAEAFCDSKVNLICDAVTNTCDCQKLIPELPINSTTIRMGDACVGTKGSTCIPSEDERHEECATGTQCLISGKVESERCEYDSITYELRARNKILSFDYVNILRVSYTELAKGFCKCV